MAFFVILKKIYLSNTGKKLDAATKIGLGALKNVSKNAVHKAPENKSHHHVKVGFFEDDWWYKCWWHTIHVCFEDFRKNQWNETKIFSRKCNGLIKDNALWGNKS